MKKPSHYTVAELAKITGVSRHVIRKRCQEGTIEGAEKVVLNNLATWFIPSEYLYQIRKKTPGKKPASKSTTQDPQQADLFAGSTERPTQ